VDNEESSLDDEVVTSDVVLELFEFVDGEITGEEPPQSYYMVSGNEKLQFDLIIVSYVSVGVYFWQRARLLLVDKEKMAWVSQAVPASDQSSIVFESLVPSTTISFDVHWKEFGLFRFLLME